MLGCEAIALFKRIGDMLLAKWEMDYGTVMGWVHARLSFVILHATLLCVWGKLHALGLVDGASIAIAILVSFAFVLFSYTYLLGLHDFLL